MPAGASGERHKPESPPPSSRTCNVGEGLCVWGFGVGWGGIECLLDKHTEAGRDRVSPGWAHIEL